MVEHNNSSDLIKIDEIFNILKREIQLNTGPQPIPQNLYQNISNLISLLKEQDEKENIDLLKEDDEKEENETTEKTLKQINSNLINLIAKLATLLFIFRCKKIFNASKSGDNFDYSNLTDEEKYVFFGNREREQRINMILRMLLEGKPKTLEKIVSSINQNFIIIRFLDSMEQFVGVNMNKYGPYEKDDVAILPFENARSIIENKKAVEVHKIN